MYQFDVYPKFDINRYNQQNYNWCLHYIVADKKRFN
jgi:hypothetical protein